VAGVVGIREHRGAHAVAARHFRAGTAAGGSRKSARESRVARMPLKDDTFAAPCNMATTGGRKNTARVSSAIAVSANNGARAAVKRALRHRAVASQLSTAPPRLASANAAITLIALGSACHVALLAANKHPRTPIHPPNALSRFAGPALDAPPAASRMLAAFASSPSRANDRWRRTGGVERGRSVLA